MQHLSGTTSHPTLRAIPCLVLLLGGSIFVATITPLVVHSTTTDAVATTTATGTEPVVLETLHTDITERRLIVDEATDVITTRSSSPTPALDERTQDRFRNLAANTSNRLDAVVERLKRITARTNTRITILEQAGHNTTSAARAVAVATESLDQTTTDLRTIDRNVERFLSSADVEQSFAALRLIYTTIQQNTRDAHTALRIALNELEAATANDAVSSPDTPTVRDI